MNKDAQKFCDASCKRNHSLQQKKVWDSAVTTPVVSPFVPLLDRLGVELIEGPAGTGKSRAALDICIADQDEKVAYLTSSWIAAFEFASKLASAGLSPFIPAARGDLTDIAIRARDKEFPSFRNPAKGVKHITILIASMTHSSHFQSFRQEETRQNKKSRCFHQKRTWAINESTPLGRGLVTLGKMVPLPTTLIIDEAGTVLDSVLQTISVGVKRVVLLGDRFQRKPIEDKEITEVMKPFQLFPLSSNSFREAPSDRVSVLHEGHRCPKDAYALMSAFYQYNVVGLGARNTTPSLVTDIIAVPTLSSLRKGEYTIDELQGQTCEGLSIHTRTASDMGFLRMHPESVLVAMSRHTSRFSWIDVNDHPHNITEFFSRFVNKKVPFNHPDKSLVASRLIAKSRVPIEPSGQPPLPRPNSRLLSPSFSTRKPTSGSPSDRVDDSIVETVSTLRENPTVSLSTPLVESTTLTKANGVGSLTLPLAVPPIEGGLVRTSTVVPILPQVPARTGSHNPAEIMLPEDHSARISTSLQEGFQPISCNSGKLVASTKEAYILSEVPIESDLVASKLLEQIPKRRCLVRGCTYSGVAFMSNGNCVRHKDHFCPPEEEVIRDSGCVPPPSPTLSLSSEASSFSLDVPSFGTKFERTFLYFFTNKMELLCYPNPFLPTPEGSDARKKCSGCPCVPQPSQLPLSFEVQMKVLATGPTHDPDALHHLTNLGLCEKCTKIRTKTLAIPALASLSLSDVVYSAYATKAGTGLFPEFSYCHTCKKMQEGNHLPCLPAPQPELSKSQKKKLKKQK